MLAKKYILLSLLLPCFVFASDSSIVGAFENLDEPIVAVGAESDSTTYEFTETLPPVELEDVGVTDEAVEEAGPLQIEDLPEDVQSEVKQALQSFGISAAAATALLNNSFGRLALMAFLGYKSFKNFKKAFDQKVERNMHIAKGVSYLVAAGLLSQDGYTWLLNR